MLITVIIPVFNEEESIAKTVAKVSEILSQLPEKCEILIVNDGSLDNTLEKAKELAAKDERVRVVSYSKNAGLGKALRTGFNHAKGDFIVTIDADLSYDPKYIIDLLNELKTDEGVDIALGSPYMKGGGTEGVPWNRLLISKIGNKILKFTLPGKINTITCVFRAYRREVLDSLELESDGKEIHLEILSKALALGCKVKEVPAILKGRVKGKSKFKFKGTAISHLTFAIFEKPMMVFGFVGLFLLLTGFIGGIYISYLRFTGVLNPNRPLITLVVILILAGIQIISFGFIALQIVGLREEIYKVQKENRELEKNLKELKEKIDAKG